MYGHKARNAIIRVLTEAPELEDLRLILKEAPEPRAVPWSKIKGQRSRKLADRLLVELWFMGFAVSARTPNDRGDRDPFTHKAWRNSKLKPTPETTQSDVEVGAEKPA
jgi:hypothetical protein